jgi:hypothetical protein
MKDESFNDIEIQAKQRKEAVLQALHDENERLGLYKDAYGTGDTKERLLAEINILTELVQGMSIKIAELEKTHVSRNDVIEEVAKEIEQLSIAFGVDTIHSFMILIRGMKE